MGWDALLTLAVVAVNILLLVFTRIGPDIILVAGVSVLLLTGILTPGEALSGLANEGMVTVGVLYVVVAGLRETGGVDWVGGRLFGRPRSLLGAQTRMMAPIAAMSAFLNNTPLVAMMIPAVSDWSKRHGFSASKLMIPLSYAAIFGGTCSLIGTSTNLVVNGLLIARTDLRLGMFDIAWVGGALRACGHRLRAPFRPLAAPGPLERHRRGRGRARLHGRDARRARRAFGGQDHRGGELASPAGSLLG